MEEEPVQRTFGALSSLVTEDGEAATLALTGELDLDSTPAIEVALAEALGHYSRIVLDLDELTFMDSTGIAALVRIKRESERRGVEVTVRLGRSPARRVLDLVRVSEYLGVED